MNDRIKLAEAMGWKRTSIELVDAGQAHGWESPDHTLFRKTDELPDPFTDANDCNALIKHLNGLGYTVSLSHDPDSRAIITVGKGRNHICERYDNWMHGVCELALKVIGE